MAGHSLTSHAPRLALKAVLLPVTFPNVTGSVLLFLPLPPPVPVPFLGVSVELV